jgi:hypothetical protein
MTATIEQAHAAPDNAPSYTFEVAGPPLYKIADLTGQNGLLRVSRAFVYRQIKAGRIRTIKQGDATFITAAALADYIRLLEREAEAAR